MNHRSYCRDISSSVEQIRNSRYRRGEVADWYMICIYTDNHIHTAPSTLTTHHNLSILHELCRKTMGEIII